VHADMPVFTASQGPMTPASFPAGPRCPDNDRSSFFVFPLYEKKIVICIIQSIIMRQNIRHTRV
ncbi:MAG: hypothetical protein LBG06_13110, partial [Deltaproteobacteria bacterium]|nr:hypothetical protein [Deltaproteobacteria bacterium]